MAITMTDEREADLRYATATAPHWTCPDNWKDCNDAREAASAFMSELDATRAALAEAQAGWTAASAHCAHEMEMQAVYAAESAELRAALACRDAEALEIIKALGEAEHELRAWSTEVTEEECSPAGWAKTQDVLERLSDLVSRQPGDRAALRGLLEAAVVATIDECSAFCDSVDEDVKKPHMVEQGYRPLCIGDDMRDDIKPDAIVAGSCRPATAR